MIWWLRDEKLVGLSGSMVNWLKFKLQTGNTSLLKIWTRNISCDFPQGSIFWALLFIQYALFGICILILPIGVLYIISYYMYANDNRLYISNYMLDHAHFNYFVSVSIMLIYEWVEFFSSLCRKYRNNCFVPGNILYIFSPPPPFWNTICLQKLICLKFFLRRCFTDNEAFMLPLCVANFVLFCVSKNKMLNRLVFDQSVWFLTCHSYEQMFPCTQVGESCLYQL